MSIFHLQNIGGDIMQQSILGQILPEAMVCYLENYGAEKFAEIFLGEFDTPEVMDQSCSRLSTLTSSITVSIIHAYFQYIKF